MHDKVQNIKKKKNSKKTFQATCDESGPSQTKLSNTFQLTDMASSTNLLQCRQEIQTR